MIKLQIEDGLDEGAKGFATQQQMLEIFEYALNLQWRKSRTYGEAFRSQGYMGNVARVLSKVARLKNMVWSGLDVNSEDESVEDTMFDLINISAFFIINYRDRNKWGND